MNLLVTNSGNNRIVSVSS